MLSRLSSAILGLIEMEALELVLYQGQDAETGLRTDDEVHLSIASAPGFTNSNLRPVNSLLDVKPVQVDFTGCAVLCTRQVVSDNLEQRRTGQHLPRCFLEKKER